jgi:hypothetical protein
MPPAEAPTGSRIQRLIATYQQDHRNPVNHFLHVYVGWPICALGVIALPFRPILFPICFALGYAFMWTGHFVFERNLPTVFKHPTTPFVIAWDVIRQIVRGAARLVRPAPGSPG